jgi:tRNA pseudouridine55 synthase
VSDGVLLIDKPAGKTSHDVVAAVRREHRGRRVGHAGTLDPFATGLLLVLVGRATRIQRYLMALPKRYETVARLGYTSSTGDTEGEITATGNIPPDPPVLPTGEIRQRPPAYSAVKVGGRRAYELARRGEEVDIPERTVHVERFEQVWREGDRAGFEIACSSGTYVRSLVADLGDAYCLELRRTSIGRFLVQDAVAPPERGGAALIPIPLTEALRGVLPIVSLDEEGARRAGHGQAVPHPAPQDAPEGDHVLLVGPAGDPVAVGEVVEAGAVKPRVGFRGQ